MDGGWPTIGIVAGQQILSGDFWLLFASNFERRIKGKHNILGVVLISKN